MGVNPVGNVQKGFTFDGVSSKVYNTHIPGRGVYDAPVRDVEMITIPNRNGDFALDRGHFSNIQVTYNAYIVADTPAEFASAVSDLRNWLCSKKGYVRLEDDYNAGEYRLAVYKNGLPVEPFAAISGTFDIVFECKPQRYLASGETAVSIASGGTITNPTLFDAGPLLAVVGYGGIEFNGYKMNITNALMGNVNVVTNSACTLDSFDLTGNNPTQFTSVFKSVEIPVGSYGNTGDSFTANINYSVSGMLPFATKINSISLTSTFAHASASNSYSGSQYISYNIKGVLLSGVSGTNASATESGTFTVSYVWNGQYTATETHNISITAAYDAATNIITVTATNTLIFINQNNRCKR